MPNFHAHPFRIRAHLVRYEDVFMDNPEQPDWVVEAVEDGHLTPSKEQRGMLVQCRGGVLLAELGDWITQDDEERYMVMGPTQIAAQYALIS